MPLRHNLLCHCKLPPVSLDCFGTLCLATTEGALRAPSLTVILTLTLSVTKRKGKNLTAQGRLRHGNPGHEIASSLTLLAMT